MLHLTGFGLGLGGWGFGTGLDNIQNCNIYCIYQICLSIFSNEILTCPATCLQLNHAGKLYDVPPASSLHLNFYRYLWRNFPRVFTLDKLTNCPAPILTLPCQSRSRISCAEAGPVMSEIGRMLPCDPGQLLPTFQIVKSFEKKYICKVKDSIKFI